MYLTEKFYFHNALIIAKELLGKYLVRRIGRKTLSYKIVETEAYVGPHDKGSHAYGGRRTKRNEPMWGPPGHWYVYFTYGMHYMLNLVTGPTGYPSAVLIRALETAAPPPIRKNLRTYEVLRLNGPGKLTKALKIDLKLNGKPASRASGLWIEDRGEKIPPRHIKRTPRIGISYAEEWAEKPLRFVLKSE